MSFTLRASDATLREQEVIDPRAEQRGFCRIGSYVSPLPKGARIHPVRIAVERMSGPYSIGSPTGGYLS